MKLTDKYCIQSANACSTASSSQRRKSTQGMSILASPAQKPTNIRLSWLTLTILVLPLAGPTMANDEKIFSLVVVTNQRETQIERRAPTLLDGFEANDTALPLEGRAGSYGQCLTTLESGEVDWLTKPTFDLPAGKTLPSISAPRLPLAIAPT